MKIRSMIMLSALFLLTSCGRGEVSPEHVEEATKTTDTEQEEVPEESKEDIATDKEEAIYVEFAGSMPKGFEAADGWCNGSMFNVTWRKQNVIFEDGKMQLIIDKDATPANGVPYSGGEFRSKDFHTYAFEWHKDKIKWFVDGVEVHSASESIPVTKGKIMMNAWCGVGVDGWLKAFDDTKVPLIAEYQWIKFTPFE